MTKRFCDICEKEIRRNFVSKRFAPCFYDNKHYTNWRAEVMLFKSNVSNDGDLCLDCLQTILSGEEIRTS